MLLEVMFGTEIFEDRTAKVSLFAVPDKVFNTFDKEMFLAQAAIKSHIPVTRHSIEPSAHAYADGHAYRDDLGKWTRAVYNVPEGMIVKIFAHKNPGFGRRVINASQFIRMREGAAYREIRVALSQHPKARFQHAIIKGRFDLLNVEQAERRGIGKIPQYFKHTYDAAEVARSMEFRTIEPELEPMAIIRERTIRRGNDTVVVRTSKKARTLALDDED